MRNYKKVKGTAKNITKWLESREMVMTVNGEMTNEEWCHAEAASQEKRGWAVKVGKHEDLVAVLHNY